MKFAFGEVSPSILLFNMWDFEDCSNRMQKAIDMGAKSVNIVPTIKFVSPDNSNIEYFCHQRSFCEKMSMDVVSEITEQLRSCSLLAAKSGLNISFVPHVDDGGGRGIWRNNLIFNPLDDYQALSYKKSILDPILSIVKDLKNYDIKVQFAFQGEMGATVFHYPKSYLDILKEYRDEVSSDFNKQSLEFGISINYNALGGQKHNFRGKKGRKNKRLLRRLFKSVDFVGFSFYHPVETKIEKHFEFGKKKFLWELKRKGIELNKSTPLHFSEIGLGGGTVKNDGKLRGSNPRKIKRAPYAGLYSSYDPLTSPWEIHENNEFRFSFYKSLNRFIKNEKSDEINNPVTDAFIWNADSWDVLGIYPKTDGYADSRVIQLLFSDTVL